MGLFDEIRCDAPLPEGYLNFYTTEPPLGEGADDTSLWREYRAHFVAGQLQSIVRGTKDQPDTRYYGLASFRWFNTRSFMFGDPFADDESASDPADGENT